MNFQRYVVIFICAVLSSALQRCLADEYAIAASYLHLQGIPCAHISTGMISVLAGRRVQQYSCSFRNIDIGIAIHLTSKTQVNQTLLLLHKYTLTFCYS